MLSFLRPGALWLLLLALPLVILYFLRLRYRRREVGSLYIWARLAGRSEGGGGFSRRSLLLLAVQLLALALLVLALAGPGIVRRERLRPGLALLLDLSASSEISDAMGETAAVGDIGAAAGAAGAAGGSAIRITRREASIALLEAALGGLPEDGPLALFGLAGGARLLYGPGADRKELLRAARSARSGALPADEEAAARELRAWLALQRGAWSLLYVGDGGLEAGGALLAAAAAEASGGRLLALRPRIRPDWASVVDLAASPGSSKARLVLERESGRDRDLVLYREGRPAARGVLPAGLGRVELALELEGGAGGPTGGEGPGAWEARLEGEAWAGGSRFLVTGAERPVRILLLGEDPFLRAALVRPDIALARSPRLPSDFAAGDWDLVVAAGIRLPSAFPAPSLSFGEAPADAPLAAEGRRSGRLAGAGEGEALLRHLGSEGLFLREARALRLAPRVESLGAVAGDTVIAAWEDGGKARVHVGFTPAGAGVGASAGFPVLVSALLERLAPKPPTALALGEAEARFEVPGVVMVEDDRGRRPLALNLALSETSAAPRALPAAEDFLPSGPDGGSLAPAAEPPGEGGPAARYATRRLDLLPAAALLALMALLAEWVLARGFPRHRAAGGRA